MASFGQNLRSHLKRRNLSVRELAKAIGEPVATVNEWVDSKDRIPRNATVIRKIVEFFDISTHELLFGEPDPRSLVGEIIEKTEIHAGVYEITVRKVKSLKD